MFYSNELHIELIPSPQTLAFNQLSKYPIPQVPMRFEPSPHGVINANLHNLVPNVDYGYHNNRMTPDEISNWILDTQNYLNILYNEYSKKNDEQLRKQHYIEDQKIKCSQLDMELVEVLPDDIVRFIHGFLLPETRLILLEARYPNIAKDLTKLRTVKLLNFQKQTIIKHYYTPLWTSNYNRNVRYMRCLPHGFTISQAFKNKKLCIETIIQLLNAFKNAEPLIPGSYEYFHKKALRMMMSMIYISKHK